MYNSGLGLRMMNDVVKIDTGLKVLSGTTEYWNNQPTLIADAGFIFVYTDYAQDEDGNDIPGIKVGDGKAYLIDAPFIEGNNQALLDHIKDSQIHVSDEDRENWDSKITAYMDEENIETLVLKGA